MRAGALRGRVSGPRHRAQQRGPERHGLQSLRRDALLLEQLPLQGAALQLLPLRRLDQRDDRHGAEPAGHGAQPRRHGEVHLLRATDRARAGAREARGPPDPRRRDRHGLPAGVSNRGDHLRQRERPGEPSGEAQGRPAQLRATRRAQHAPTHDLPGWGDQPQPRARPRSRRGRPPGSPSRAGDTLVTPEARAAAEPPARPSLIGPGHTLGSITDKISAIVLGRRTPLAWFFGFGVGFVLFLLLMMTITNLLFRGIGIWGPNVPVAWGFG